MPARRGRSYLVPDPQGKQFVLHCPKKNPDRSDGLWPCAELTGLYMRSINKVTGDPSPKRAYWHARKVYPRMERRRSKKRPRPVEPAEEGTA